MMLGAVVAFFAVVLSAGPKPAVPLPALLWFFALPVSDMLIVIMRRLTSGSSPLRGDRLHLHHFLLRAGIAPQTAAAMLILACLVLGAVGLTGWQLGAPDQLILLGLVAPLLLHAYVVLHGWKIVARHLVARSAQAAGAPDAVHASGN